MPSRKWTKLPFDAAAFRADGAKLQKRWAALHHGDREPFPDAALLERLAKREPAFAAALKAHGGAKALAAGLQDAWRAFHAGDFGTAIESGADLGPLGAIVAGKAAGVYATCLERGNAPAVALLEAAVARCEAAAKVLPDHANAHYMHAFVLGRLSQRISIVKALAAGHATRVRASLDRTLALEPKHAEAHVALGAYHAEIVGKVGGIAAGLTYGATKAKALEHFEQALKLAPEAPIVRVEYAAALRLLDPRGGRARAETLEREAAALEPRDAMERLDVERARSAGS